MKISRNWMADFVEWTETDPEKIADRITLGTAEVEEVEQQGALMQHCCVGRIATVSKHPSADRLSLATVETDKGIKKVVCGGTNVREGMLVAFAHIGATVKWHGAETMTLEKTKIRGEESEGMICAAEELGLETLFPPNPEDGERPIVDLSNIGLDIGANLATALGQTDTILHVNNTAITHRPDLFSQYGMARECVALGLATWKKKKSAKSPAFAKTALPFKTIVEDKSLVPRYCGCLLEVDALGETPQWMKQRLEATGWRSINLPIDITNYVATELGMPLHSFDADDIQGDIRIRATKKGETIRTLDNVDRKLPESAVVLSDDQGIFDLLGIMGGLRSSTKESTRRIYLHSAIVDPVAIRRTIIATGHRTDASTVYEKGVPRVMAMEGLLRALELFLAHVPGARIVSTLENVGDDGEAPTIFVPLARIQSMLGYEIALADCKQILDSLECTVKTKGTKEKTILSVTPPLFRLRDLQTEADIIEEIGRIRGFDRIVPILPSAEIGLPARDDRTHRLRRTLAAEMFYELTPLSLLGPTLLQKAGMESSPCQKIRDPLGEDTSLFQPSTLPRLLEHAEKNLLAAGEELRTFQIGHVAHAGEKEQSEMGLLLSRRTETRLSDDPFLTLSSSLTRGLEAMGYEMELRRSAEIPGFAHPGRTADVIVAGKTIGRIFEVHPVVRKRFDLPSRAAAATVWLEALLSIQPSARIATKLSTFPAVSYDVTVRAEQSMEIGTMLQTLRAADPLLENVAVHDLYAGKEQKNGEYNLTLRFTYRSSEKTLTEEEVKQAHGKVLSALTLKEVGNG